MKPSNKNPKNRDWTENNKSVSINFDFGELDNSPVFEGFWGEILKEAISNYLSKNIFLLLDVVDSMTEEERKALLGKVLHGKSFRRLGNDLDVDKHTAQTRFKSAVCKLRNSPLVYVNPKRKSREN